MPSSRDPRPVARAARRTGPVEVDGRLGEAAWEAATPITELRQQTPDEGRPASQRTDLRILFDDDAIYVGARMYDSLGAAGVRAPMARRDALLGGGALTSDKIAIVLDTFRDRNGRTWFEINPLGVKGDHQNGDGSYDPVWEGAAHVDSLGWSAEMRIPYSQLRFPRSERQLWGMQVWRTTDRRNEYDMWAFWRSNEPGGPPYFGTLEGITVGGQPRQLEVVPYVTSRARFARAADADPYHANREARYNVGGDVKYNLTTNLTLDATVNPDFGQVEVDPAQVNLSAFETTFSEKRPFFVANSQYFSFGGFSCYFCSNVSSLGLIYSRRVGRTPQLAGLVAGRAQFADVPDATTILGAAKVTGRTARGLSVGVLEAVTNRETARFRVRNAPPGAPELEQEVEPLSNYFVSRLRQDYRGGATRVGVIATLVNRALRDSAERAQLRAHGAVLGFDVDHRLSNRTYSLVSQVALTDVGGDTAAIRRTQQSSARYFQRPGREADGGGWFDAAYDPTRRALRGYGLYARVAKDAGNWLWETSQNWRSPGYEVNDLGSLGRADYRWMNANLVRSWSRPGSWYRNLWIGAGGQQQFNYDGDRNDAQLQANVNGQFLNWWNFYGFAIHHPTVYDERLTRGGPTVRRYGYDFLAGGFGTDSRKAAVWSLDLQTARPVGADAGEGGQLTVSPSVSLKPSPRVLLSLSPSWDRSRTPQQYVASAADAAVPAGFAGRRYLFAHIEQTTVAMNTRLNTTFTPDLTLELFAQPFLASGRYSNFKEFVGTRTDRMRVFGRDVGTVTPTVGPGGHVDAYRIDPDGAGPAAAITLDNPDFNIRSLRGTAVMRWEYRPGSTLFLVWTQERSGSDGYGNFDFGRDRAALFRDRPTNVFQVKATYWIGR
jgi:hypothetical protein